MRSKVVQRYTYTVKNMTKWAKHTGGEAQLLATATMGKTHWRRGTTTNNSYYGRNTQEERHNY
jgi:hypothetical protein